MKKILILGLTFLFSINVNAFDYSWAQGYSAWGAQGLLIYGSEEEPVTAQIQGKAYMGMISSIENGTTLKIDELYANGLHLHQGSTFYGNIYAENVSMDYRHTGSEFYNGTFIHGNIQAGEVVFNETLNGIQYSFPGENYVNGIVTRVEVDSNALHQQSYDRADIVSAFSNTLADISANGTYVFNNVGGYPQVTFTGTGANELQVFEIPDYALNSEAVISFENILEGAPVLLNLQGSGSIDGLVAALETTHNWITINANEGGLYLGNSVSHFNGDLISNGYIGLGNVIVEGSAFGTILSLSSSTIIGAVPEPSEYLMFFVGLTMIAGLIRYQRHSSVN